MSISLLIVGHANTGKTSLIRTLMRDHHFGEVSNQAGTTRHVEKITLALNGKAILELIDTPGFEDSIGLWQIRQSPQYKPQNNRDWLSHIQHDPALIPDFEQELKIIKQLQQADIILYVIDLRQAPLGKYLNELDILACANKPIVPVLNFCKAPSRHESDWKNCLAERQLHAYVPYDSVAFYFADERKLYQTLQSLAPDHYDALQALIKQREEDANTRLGNAQLELTKTLLACATEQFTCRTNTPTAEESDQFEDIIRQQEQAFIQTCLDLYAFTKEDVALDNLDIQKGQWQQDLFDSETLKSWGINSSTGAATGAVIGAGIDLLSAGLTLGTATTLGALLGAGVQTGRSFKSSIANKLRQRAILALAPSTLIALLKRGEQLILHLHHRGHASQQAYTSHNEPTQNSQTMINKAEMAQLEKLFQRISQRTEWHHIDELPQHKYIQALQQEIQANTQDH